MGGSTETKQHASMGEECLKSAAVQDLVGAAQGSGVEIYNANVFELAGCTKEQQAALRAIAATGTAEHLANNAKLAPRSQKKNDNQTGGIVDWKVGGY